MFVNSNFTRSKCAMACNLVGEDLRNMGLQLSRNTFFCINSCGVDEIGEPELDGFVI